MSSKQESLDELVASGAFGESVDKVSMALVRHAIEQAEGEPVTAVAAIVVAAARAAAMSGINFGTVLNLFVTQHGVMDTYMKSRSTGGSISTEETLNLLKKYQK